MLSVYTTKTDFLRMPCIEAEAVDGGSEVLGLWISQDTCHVPMSNLEAPRWIKVLAQVDSFPCIALTGYILPPCEDEDS